MWKISAAKCCASKVRKIRLALNFLTNMFEFELNLIEHSHNYFLFEKVESDLSEYIKRK